MVGGDNKGEYATPHSSAKKPNYYNRFSANAPMYFYDATYDSAWIFDGFKYNMDVLGHIWGKVLPVNGLDTVQGKIITPVFLALGKYDFVCPFYLWDSDKDRLPNLSYNLFEKSGHFPMLEEQELFDQKLTDWVKSH
jgi:proline iminopeptidase